MALPKQVKKKIDLFPEKTGYDRRLQLLEDINKYGTYLPKSIVHEDLDRGFLDFVKENLKTYVDGKLIPIVDIIITTQNWAQFTQTWNFQDLDSNISPPFIATVRKPETPYGTNQGTSFKIPGRPTFQYALVPTFDGARNGYDVYKIPQPTPVDITYEIKVFTNRMRELNSFNKKELETFGSKQAYTLIKDRYLPITLENITDESVSDLGKRRYYIQTYTMKLKGVLLDEEQFERTPAMSRVLTMLDVGVKTKQRKAMSPNPNENTVEGLYQFLTTNVSNTLTETVRTNFDYYFIKSVNVSSYDVYINNLLMGTDIDYFQVNLNDVLTIEVTKDDGSKDSSILFDKKLV